MHDSHVRFYVALRSGEAEHPGQRALKLDATTGAADLTVGCSLRASAAEIPPRVGQMAPKMIHMSACAIAGAHNVPVRSRSKPRMSPQQKWLMIRGNAN